MRIFIMRKYRNYYEISKFILQKSHNLLSWTILWNFVFVETVIYAVKLKITLLFLLAGVTVLLYSFTKSNSKSNPNNNSIMSKSIYDYKVKTIDHKEVSLSEYKGKVLLIVNVASQCGLTPQYKDLQALYEKYHAKGLEILGFPANNFGHQEPGTEEEIKSFCSKNYNVTFPMFEKVSVKGNDMCELYQFLTKKELNGAMNAEVSWNFEKFLIDKNGKLVANYEPTTKPMSEKITEKIEELLK